MQSIPPHSTQARLSSPNRTDSDPPMQREDPPPLDIPPWPPWTAPAALGVGLGLAIVVGAVVAIAAQLGGSSPSNQGPAVDLIGNVLADAAFVAAAVYFAALHGRLRMADFGLRKIGWRTGVGAVLVAGFGYWVITILYASALHIHGNEKLPKQLGVGNSTAALIGAAVFVCVVAPIAEEFFFRGFIFGALRRMHVVVAGRDLGVWSAALLTAVLFGLAHVTSAAPKYLVLLGVFGFILCLVRWWTRSLYPCIAMHSINNSAALGLSQLHWSGGEILLLILASLLVIGGLTAPLAGRAAAIP